jgi:hypothetical protein
MDEVKFIPLSKAARQYAIGISSPEQGDWNGMAIIGQRQDPDSDKVIFEFPVMHIGWELDNTGWVMERPDGGRYLRLTSHGSEYEADEKELHAKIEEYDEAIDKTRKALRLLRPDGIGEKCGECGDKATGTVSGSEEESYPVCEKCGEHIINTGYGWSWEWTDLI